MLMRASTDAHSVVHQVLLPKGLQEEALRDAHDRAGHLGMVKTYQRLGARTTGQAAARRWTTTSRPATADP